MCNTYELKCKDLCIIQINKNQSEDQKKSYDTFLGGNNIKSKRNLQGINK